MKKFCAFLLSVLLLLTSACGYTQDDIEAARKAGYESGYKVGFEEGYDTGHEEGYDAGHEEGYDEGHKDGYSLATKPKPVREPASGTILSGKEYSESEITVTADGTYSYVVKLKTLGGSDRLSFFVRAGDTVTVGVPAEYLYVYFASGDTWYGEDNLFGEETCYSKDDESLDFTQYTWEYTLYPVTNGNFSVTPSDAEEFN